MSVIRINIEQKVNVSIIRERKTWNVPMIEKVFIQIEMKIWKANINIWDYTRMIFIVRSRPRESELIWVIRNFNWFVAIYIGWTGNGTNSWPRRFLDKNNVKTFTSFQYNTCDKVVLLNILREDLDFFNNHTWIPPTTSKSMFSNSHGISNTSSHTISC